MVILSGKTVGYGVPGIVGHAYIAMTRSKVSF